MGFSEDDTIQGPNESDSDSDSWESAVDSGPVSAAGDDCLKCSDTKETIVMCAHKKFHKKV